MTEPTESDRVTALGVIRKLGFVPLGHDMSPAAEVVAVALAAEREKASARREIVAHVPVSDDGPWMVGVEAPETPDEALERCASWVESLASATLSNDPHIRAADWAAKLVRQFAAERPGWGES